jgi:RNA polymerase sigma factor (sigma-70 family)
MLEEDRILLARYAREGCERAFEELVRRHIDMVWGAACRVTGDGELARDVAQGVFNDLARKGRFFPGTVSVPGWLYRAAVMAARNAVRTNIRRSRREREAMETYLPNPPAKEPDVAAVERLMPLLDEGLQTLGANDREVVVLRFFAGKSLAEIGRTFAISEDAAQKRVSRALERLKGFFARQGEVVSAGVVLSALTAAGTVAAPVGIAGTIAGVSCAAASTGALGSAVSFLAGAGEQIVFMKAKIVVASLATVAVGAPLVIQQQTLGALERDRAELSGASRDIAELRAEHARTAEQRQPAAEWAQYERERAELAQLRAEAGRLREVAAANPELQRKLAEARRSFEAAKASAKFANDTVQAEELKVRTVEAMKHLGLAARIFATDNADRFPKSFEEMKNELGEKLSGNLPLETFEFVEHEREISETEPQLLLFREKEPRQLPNGKWTRAYTLADGSVQNPERDSPDFSDWEKDFIGRKNEQASR